MAGKSTLQFQPSSLRVGRSKTGLGLFAVKPIKKRTIFLEYKGPRLNAKQAEAMEAKGSRYLYEISTNYTIDGSARKNIGRYANHSCVPNTESDVLYGKRAKYRPGGIVVLRAIKNINAGDEILYDYGTDYWKAYIGPEICACPRCVKRRAKKRAEVRAANARKKKRAAKKAAADKSASKSRKSSGKKKSSRR